MFLFHTFLICMYVVVEKKFILELHNCFVLIDIPELQCAKCFDLAIREKKDTNLLRYTQGGEHQKSIRQSVSA